MMRFKTNLVFIIVLTICLIPLDASGAFFTRNGYEYSTINENGGSGGVTIVSYYKVSQIGRDASSGVWYCNSGGWIENGIPVSVIDLNVNGRRSYSANTLYVTGIELKTVTCFNVSGLKTAILGHDDDRYGNSCTIKQGAFASSSKTLTCIKIRKGIEAIESKAFYGMTEGEIIFKDMKLPTLADDAFCEEAYNNVMVVVPDVKFALFQDSNWRKFKKLVTYSHYYCEFAEPVYVVPIGATKTLSFTTDIDPTEFRWSSSDDNIAEVSKSKTPDRLEWFRHSKRTQFNMIFQTFIKF